MILGALLGFAALSPPAEEGARALDREARPRLAVLLVVDQLIPEQIPRLLPVLHGGLGAIWREGLVLEGAALAHGLTFTAPGHVSAGTGVVPARHGVVANGWYDAEAKRSVYCCEDDLVRRVDGDGVHEDTRDQRRSPRLTRVPGIADFLEEAFPEAKTVSIGGKDRAAVGTPGQRPDLAVWWDKPRGAGFVTSTWYARELPAWVRAWNETWLASASGASWEPLVPLERLAELGTAADDREGEYRALEGRRTFPYHLPRLAEEGAKGPDASAVAEFVYTTPFVDRYVLALAREALVALELGGDEVPDLLCVTLPAVDTVGHLFGPLSAEVSDTIVRLDRELGALFALLDERVGRERWVLGFTSDHGVLELPEELLARGLPAGRRSAREVDAAFAPVRAALAEQIGSDAIQKRDDAGVYLDRAALRAAERDLAAVRAALRTTVREKAKATWPHAYTLEEVAAAAAVLVRHEEGKVANDPLLHLLAASFDAERSPDVFLVGPERVLLGEPGGTTHGTPYDYDRRIPLAFLGGGVPAEHRAAPGASSLDVVPTLLHALGIDPGRPLDGRSRLR